MSKSEPHADKVCESDRDDAPTTDDYVDLGELIDDNDESDLRADGGVGADTSGASVAQPVPEASADELEADATEATDDDTTDLDEPFTVTASGPVRYKRGFEDGVVETHEITVEIEREITTVEEFDRFYGLHESMAARADAVSILTKSRAGYCITRGEADQWGVEIDGPVAAYRSAAEDRGYHRLTKSCVFSDLFGPGAHVAQLDCQRTSDNSLDEYLRDFAEELEVVDD